MLIETNMNQGLEKGAIKLKYTLKHQLLNIKITDICFWIDMSVAKKYDLLKFQENSIGKCLNYFWSRVCKFLRRYHLSSVYSMNVRHHCAHLLIVSHKICFIYLSSIYKQSILI